MIHFDLDKVEKEKQTLESQIGSDGFWNNQREAQKIINKFNSMNDKINSYRSLVVKVNSVGEMLELLKEAYDEEIHASISEEILVLKNEFEEYSVNVLLVGEYDDSNVIVEIHPGAGGTESQDWADMLYRMYIRYAEKNGYKIQMID